MTKHELLADIKRRMLEDVTLPLRTGATQLVFGEGNPDADVYFLGEAPGYFEDKQGRPFVGLAGKLLDQLVESLGMKRADVYISNIVRFRPPANRDPEPDEIAAFAPYVDEEIKIINPKIIVTLGRFSMAKFLPMAKISTVHGRPHSLRWEGRDMIVVPMYHPAAALRAGVIMSAIKEDFLVINKLIKDDSSVHIEKIGSFFEEKNGKEESQLNLGI